MHLVDPLGFRWDADKAEANIAKHAIAFEDAVRIFGGLTYDVASMRSKFSLMTPWYWLTTTTALFYQVRNL